MDMSEKNFRKSSDVKLIQFKLSEKAYTDLTKLKDETGSITLSEVIRDSLRLYQWAIEMRKKGYTLFCLPEDEDDKKFEVVLPFVNP